MNRSCHSLTFSEMGRCDTKGAPTPLVTPSGIKANPGASIAQRCLRLLDPKTVADHLHVAVRTVQKWVSGEASIPSERTNNIMVEAKNYFLTDLHQLEDSIDRMLVSQFGNNHDRGAF